MGQHVDRRSDIFSAGAVFYEFLGLREALQGQDAARRAVPDHPGGAGAAAHPEPAACRRAWPPSCTACCARTPTSATSRWTTCGARCSTIHAALRRSHAPLGRQPRGRRPSPRRSARACASTSARGRAHLDAGRLAQATADAERRRWRSIPPARRRRRSLWQHRAQPARTSRRPPTLRSRQRVACPAGRAPAPGRSRRRRAGRWPSWPSSRPTTRAWSRPRARRARGPGSRCPSPARARAGWALRCPVVVTGRDEHGRALRGADRDPATSAAAGCASRPARRLPIGARLRLDIRLSQALRPRFGGRARYAVRAVVCRMENFAGEDRYRVGVRFLADA